MFAIDFTVFEHHTRNGWGNQMRSEMTEKSIRQRNWLLANALPKETHKSLFSFHEIHMEKRFFCFLFPHMWGEVSVCAPKNNSTSPNRRYWSFVVLPLLSCFCLYFKLFFQRLYRCIPHSSSDFSSLVFIKIGWEDGKSALWIACISSRIFSIPIACCCCYTVSAPGLMEIFINFSSICQSRTVTWCEWKRTGF